MPFESFVSVTIRQLMHHRLLRVNRCERYGLRYRLFNHVDPWWRETAPGTTQRPVVMPRTASPKTKSAMRP